tara:strand:- start:4358 stop:5770 length:1413 start_codon:yes stop_codon:yes gene_type:complete
METEWKYMIKKVILIQILIILFFSVELLIFNWLDPEKILIEILKYELVIIYIYTVISSKRYLKWTSLYLIFLFTLGLFIFSRIFLDIFGIYQFEWANKWRNFLFPLKTQITLLSYLIISLVVIHLGALLSLFTPRRNKVELKPYAKLEEVSLYLFFLSFPGILYKYILQFKFIINNGYTAVYDGSLNLLSYPYWTFGSGTLMEVSFCLFLASKPSKKKFMLISVLFFILKIIDVLKGGRSKLFLPVLFIAWFYYQFYSSSDLKLKKLFVYSTVGILLSQAILIFRDSNNLAFENSGFFLSLFFAQQGISILVLGYMINYKTTFVNTGWPYIIYPLTIFSASEGQSYEYINETISLGHRLSYFLSPEGYLQGEGIGSSFLGELYDLGFIGFVLGSFFVGMFIIYFEHIIKYNRIWLLLSLYIMQTIVYMPRASIFPISKDIILLVVFYLVIHSVLKNKTNDKVLNPCSNTK